MHARPSIPARARARLLDRVLPALPALLLLLLIFAAAAARAQDSTAVTPRMTVDRLTIVVMPFDAPMGSLDRGKRFRIETLAPVVPMLIPGAGGALPANRFALPMPASTNPSSFPPAGDHGFGRPRPQRLPDDGHASRVEHAMRVQAREDPAVNDVGVAVAGLLTARLVADGRFRVLDAAQLASLRRAAEECEANRRGRRCDRAAEERPPGPGELYLVTGAILRLGPQERSAIAGAGRFSLLGVLGFKRKRMEMTVMARVVDAATGEVIASTTAQGRSDAKGSVGGGAVGAGTVAGVGVSEQGGGPTEQAMTRAVEALATDLARMATEHGSRKR